MKIFSKSWVKEAKERWLTIQLQGVHQEFQPKMLKKERNRWWPRLKRREFPLLLEQRNLILWFPITMVYFVPIIILVSSFILYIICLNKNWISLTAPNNEEFSEDEVELFPTDKMPSNAGETSRQWQNRLWETLLESKDKGRKQPMDYNESSWSKRNLWVLALKKRSVFLIF